MSFMEVITDDLIEDGWYEAVLKSVEKKENQRGEYLLFRFLIPELNAIVAGFSSTSASSQAKGFKWVCALNGDIASKRGWDPDDVVERPCEVFVETYEDGQGRTNNKVTKVRPPKT